MAETTARLSRDRRKTAIIVAAGASALALLAWLAIGQTVAGFTAQTENTDNTFEAGSVTISDDDAGEALFVYDDLLPGHSHTEVITVTNESTAPLDVKLYAANVTETAATHPDRTTPAGETGLAENLDVVVTIITPDTTDTNPVVFSGTLAELKDAVDWSTAHSAEADGDDVTAANGAADTDDLVYEITVSLKETAGNEDQNVWPDDVATVNFIWEGRA